MASATAATPRSLQELAAELVELHRWRVRVEDELLRRMESSDQKKIEVRLGEVLQGRVAYQKASTSRSVDGEAAGQKIARYAKLLHELGACEGIDAELPRGAPVERRASLRVTLA